MGYDVEIHLVDTEDGYTLALERVPHSRSNQIVGSPVLLLHGLFSNSLVFALNRTSLGKKIMMNFAGNIEDTLKPHPRNGFKLCV